MTFRFSLSKLQWFPLEFIQIPYERSVIHTLLKLIFAKLMFKIVCYKHELQFVLVHVWNTWRARVISLLHGWSNIPIYSHTRVDFGILFYHLHEVNLYLNVMEI